MAPKDFSTKSPQQQQLYLQHHHHRSTTPVALEDEISLVSSGSNSQNEKHPLGWKLSLLIQLRKLMRGEEDTITTAEEGETDSDESSTSPQHYQQQQQQQLTKWGSAAMTTVAVFLLYKFAKNRRLKQRLWPILLTLFRKPDHANATQVSLSLLRSAAVQGIITKALIGTSEIVFQDASNKWKRSVLPPNSPTLQSDLLQLLAENGCGDVSTMPPTVWARLSGPLLTALPFIYLGLVYKIFKNIHGDDVNPKSKLLDNSKQTTRFSDVAGLDSIISEVNDIVAYLKNPSYYLQLGAQPPRGILLHGPPGSGKTLLAQALAGEGDCDAFITCSGSEFCEMYVGRGTKRRLRMSLYCFLCEFIVLTIRFLVSLTRSGAARVRSVFAQARKTAIDNHKDTSSWFSQFSPYQRRRVQSSRSKNTNLRPPTAIIFIDELDALAKSRSGGSCGTSNDERDQTLNQLLIEMDGFSSRQCGVTIIVIAATNRADVLDPAILRRFDRQIHVPYPDAVGRREILKIHARKIQCQANTINWDVLAAQSANCSGSDLRNVVNDAALLAVRDKSRSVQERHLLQALDRIRSMKGNISNGLMIPNNGSLLWTFANIDDGPPSM